MERLLLLSLLPFRLLKRKQNDWQAVCELTGNLSKFDPADPVKYDFVLTRFGIRDDMNIDNL